MAAGRSSAHAQAWVDDQGSLAGELDYNLAKSDKILGTNGMQFPQAGVTTHQVTLHAEYVPVEKLGLDLRLPMVAMSYDGNKTAYTHPGGGKYDDGNLHTTLTDLALRARYQVLLDPLAVAPHLGISIPVADYENVGNAVAGRHLKALHVGASLGKQFLETFYAHFMYDLTWAEAYDKTPTTAKYNQRASDFNFSLGDWLLDNKLDVNVDAQYHFQHAGINFADFARLPADVVEYHDPILKESVFLLGAGVGYQLNDKFTIAASYRYFVSGNNTQNASVLGATVSWNIL